MYTDYSQVGVVPHDTDFERGSIPNSGIQMQSALLAFSIWLYFSRRIIGIKTECSSQNSINEEE